MLCLPPRFVLATPKNIDIRRRSIVYRTIAQIYVGSLAPALLPRLQAELFLRQAKECSCSSDPRAKTLSTVDPSGGAHPGPR